MTDPYNPLVQDLTPLNEVKYAARDYPSIYDSLFRRLKIEYEDVYNDYSTTLQGIMFIELMAYAIQQLQFYLDRTASDCFLDTARTRAAVARLVKQIGYKMGAASSSSTNLTLTFTDGTTGPFILPARWQFLGPNGLIYESYAAYSQPVALSPGDTIEIPVRQGETRLLSYTSDGSKNQQYRLTNIADDRFLGDGTVDVWVDGLLWDEVEFLEFEKSNQYEVGYNDSPPIVQFGDGIAGNVPPEGAEVKIRFVIVAGELGNVKANSITSSIDTLFIGGDEVAFTVDNATEANGGQDPEDPERAKKLAPFSFAARGAAITQPDYEALSESFSDPTYGTVAKSFAFNPRGAYQDSVFNTLAGNIDQNLSDYLNGGGVYTGALALETDLNSKAADLVDPLNGFTDDLTDLETIRSGLETNIGTATTDCETARSEGRSAESSAQLSADECQDAITEISDLETYIGTLSSLTPTEVAQLLSYTGTINGHVNAAYTYSSNARTSASSAASASGSAINNALTPANLVVADPSPTGAPDVTIPTIITDMGSDKDDIDDVVNGSGGIIDLAASISGQATLLNDNVSAIGGLNGEMQERVGELFNADCLSNFVQVPILSLDTDGNYTAPSVGLITGLQARLDEIKEVTQHVEVVDGSSLLVPAEIAMLLEVNKAAYVESEVVSDAVATVIGLLKKRDFNDPLYLSTLYENVEALNGVVRVNIEITGPASSLDAEGNLVPTETNRVISFGSLIIRDKDGNVLYSG